MLRPVYLLCVSIFLAGCAVPTAPPKAQSSTVTQVSTEFPEDYYRQAKAQGHTVLRVDPAKSVVVIEVHRAGKLSYLGHDHVVVAHDVRGLIAPDLGRADLLIQLDQLVVDESTYRAEAGFDTQPSLVAIEGTRQNMLNKVLEATRFPSVLISITRLDPTQSNLQVAITLHGVQRVFEVPAQIENNADGISVSGRLSFNQTDFGMVPFSVMAGAMRVEDRLDLRFHITGMSLQ